MSSDEPVAASAGRQAISPDMVRALLGFVEVALGGEVLDEVVAEVDEDLTVAELMRPDRWASAREYGALAAAVERHTGEPQVGRQVGLVSFQAVLAGPAAATLRQLGSVRPTIHAMASHSSRMSTHRRYHVVESDEHHAVLADEWLGPDAPPQISCDMTTGFFGALPRLFGAEGIAIEPRCRRRGDARCEFRVVWSFPDTPGRGRGRVVPGRTEEDQLEQTHEAAAALVEAGSVDDVLARIVTQVSTAVMAPKFLLSVTGHDSADRKVHQVGMGETEATALADALAAGEPPPGEAMVAPIELQGRPIGHLAALLPGGVEPTERERRMLRSYARYAASALEIVTALEQARADRETSDALLDLARQLSDLSDAEAVADAVAEAMVDGLDADIASVWLLGEDDSTLQRAAGKGRGQPDVALPVDEAVPTTIQRDAFLHERRARVLDAGEVEGVAGELMRERGLAATAIAPVMAKGSLLGLLTATFATPLGPGERPEVLTRLGGMADQAATAFENARHLAELRHRALHDELTGLPRRLLAEDRCRHALARRGRTNEDAAVLFVDLDGFKAINDRHGHAAGDDVLRESARRIQGALRATDTCARLGGDEFIVVASDLTVPDDALEIGKRILDRLDEPIDLDGTVVRVTASIGVTCATDGDDFEALLQRSDAAMYEAKRAGRSRVVLG